MLRSRRAALSATLALFLALFLAPVLACDKPDAAAETSAGVDSKAEANTKTAADPAPDEMSDPNALTEEDKRLIAADTQTLSPEENRKRAHALRKKIMQNPDSPAAQALEDARAAALAGEVSPLPAKPEGRVIPLPDHLRQESIGEPAPTGDSAKAAPAD